jgi:hypothetical protein
VDGMLEPTSRGVELLMMVSIDFQVVQCGANVLNACMSAMASEKRHALS